MKIASVFLALIYLVPSFAIITVRAENDFARRLQAAGSAGPDRLRSDFVIDAGLGGRNIRPNQRWKDRNGDVVIVPYQIVTSYFTPAQIQQIESAVNELSDLVRSIKLVKRTNQAAYIRVIQKENGCWSWVGKQSTGKAQELNLGDGCFLDGIIQHEFMHALGFNHEQVRSSLAGILLY